MKLIQNYHSELDTLQVLISKLTDGYSIVTIGDYIVSEMIRMIEEDLGFEDMLDWWLFENVDKVIYEHDPDGNEKEISVRTLDELYDYIVRSRSEVKV
jgi:hypothetical protein